MKKNKTRRQSATINIGSMADIAFLLLIFFLITTTTPSDQGILVKLPPYDIAPPPMARIWSRNILKVSLNSNDQLLVMGEKISIPLLKEKVKLFILNPDKNLSLAIKPLVMKLIYQLIMN